ncbi:MAG TPA: nicotinate-nucleotide adenylyltransferase [Cellvibrionaceae bacterium]
MKVHRVGILGGTFNPIHHGHLRLALDVVQQLQLSELRLIPCHIPAHRAAPSVSASDRAQMVSLAVADEPSLVLDSCELERPGPSYTIETLKALRAELGPDAVLVLVLGVDAYLGLASWKDWRALVDYAHILVATRPGWQLPETGEVAEFTRAYQADVLPDTPAGSVLLLQGRLLDISATEIRALTAKAASTRYLLPEAVRHFIHQQRLYLAAL